MSIFFRFLRRNPTSSSLIVATLLVFLLQKTLDPQPDLPGWMHPSGVGAYAFGAVINDGQFWRLVSYLFLHVSPWHLIGNMAALASVGAHLERRIGSAGLLAAYLICGLGASLALFVLTLCGCPFLHGAPVVGASGALVGMVAATLILCPGLCFDLEWIVVPYAVLFSAFLLLCIVLLFRGTHPDAEACHLSSAVCGALVGCVVKAHGCRKKKRQGAVRMEWDQGGM